MKDPQKEKKAHPDTLDYRKFFGLNSKVKKRPLFAFIAPAKAPTPFSGLGEVSNPGKAHKRNQSSQFYLYFPSPINVSLSIHIIISDLSPQSPIITP